jgi:hypothetical protein
MDGGVAMAQEVKIILDLSDEVQTFLEQQQINLYEELQQEIPSLRLAFEPDPDAPEGKRDPTTVILAVATLVSSVTPLIIRILNQYTPANRTAHWEVEETETRQPDGTVIIQRRRVSSSDEQRPWTTLPSPTRSPSETSTPHSTSRNQP